MHISSLCTVATILIAAAIISPTSAFDSTLPPRLPGLSRREDNSCSAVDPKLPSGFSCPTGSNCISLDASSSALCCPESSSCDNIQTISCDVASQNATSNPTAGIFTIRLGDKLPTCGTKCCPFGYNCVRDGAGNSVCTIIKSTSIVGKTEPSSGNTSSSSTATSSATRTATSTASTTSSTTSSSAVSASAAQATPRCNKFPIGVFLAGLFPGMFVGAFLMLGWVICSGRHRKPSSRSSTGSSISYKPTISDPIPMAGGGGLRTDFLRKTTDRAKSMFSTQGNRNSEQYVNNWKMPTPPVPNNVPVAPVGVPVTPERRLPLDSDTESIKVYSPPSATMRPPNAAHIAPLRGMATQRLPFQNNSNNNMGSPFQTPPNNNTSTNPNRMSATLRDERGVSVFSEGSAENDGPTLTPARYDGGFNPTKRTEVSRPNTTFTEMLHEAGFPDPMNGTPAVPKIPEGYTGKSRF
ncbi:hypothetical protein G647_01565 [Cladophialophora carrionii CBS 160.54]|uniref:Mid2 domain-containing protein n=1 Tax=Cladophialophora carrionii CBS 160.54 TaxID=1279043 RepID=V9DT13_9EURO|nr:uncharacterized protein G647_01565 [Cladophialophora carrionii CBS 160.54]ETI29112.1 hypothetical protein G647_01565 [Cladophialophora carrionii CBS 160.54]